MAARTIAERWCATDRNCTWPHDGNHTQPHPIRSDRRHRIGYPSDEEARRRRTQKTVLERRSPPTFDVLVEIQERNYLVIHPDVAEAVDNLVRVPLRPEIRYIDEKLAKSILKNRLNR